MVEYVYARHDFVPEHDDEVPFHAGDRIEVLEKDEQYTDGWWLGRNLAGKVGLFPQTYTQPAPPSAEPPSSALSTLAPPPAQAEDIPSPVSSLPNPVTASFQSLPNDSDLSPTANDIQPNLSASKSNGEVMLATMTDVQQAIEQLGHNDDFDGSRSFTFSSTRGESTDHETDAEADGEDWHKGARQKLAEKAKKAAEMQAVRDAENGRVPMRSTVPPIDVEMSEDSGDEDEHPHHDLSPNGRTRLQSHIPEVDEEDPVPPQTQDRPRIPDSPPIQPSSHYLVPSPLQPAPEFSQDRATESDVPTATQSLFPQNMLHTPENDDSSLPTPVSPNLRGISNGTSAGSNDAAHHPPAAQLPFPSKSKSHTQTLSLQDAAGILPSPAASLTGHRPGYSISSVNSSARVNASSPLSGVRSADLSAKKPRHVHPTDWTVEEVVDWLHSKGFDDAVCEKFIEQEITGDVLLELDVAVLKSEIGITAYGKRMRIWNAIAELRRPPSLMSSSAEHLTRGGSFSRGSAPPQHGKTPSSSLMVSVGLNNLVSPESPSSSDMAAASSILPRRDSDPGVRSTIVSNPTDSNATIGLGIGIPPSLIPGNAQNKAAKGRPSHLSLSPSDGALAASAKDIAIEQEQGDKDRGVLSDSDAKSFITKGRGSLFRRHNSSSSTGKTSPQRSKEATSPRSDISPRSEGARSRPQPRKRSLDATREGSRLSIFGSTFVGTLAKARKPPPRYPTPDGELSPDRGTLSLSRLYHGSGSRKSSSVRSSPLDAPGSHGKEDKREKRASKDSGGKKDSLLRKRISSASDGSPTSSRADPGSLKAGQSILQQIGTPEHVGWMRKKGEHYNTWKNRYFVLKGPHLYWLKSNNPSETKIKGYINIVGYRIIADENVDPGRYGFKLVHESDRTHFFSSDDQAAIREWMKALMKATIDRDYNKPVVSSVNVPTIPLAVAQAMNPAPRPPSPGARAATQRAMRRENTNQLSTRDAEILMGGISSPVSPYSLDSDKNAGSRRRLESFFNHEFPAVDPILPSRSPTLQSPPPVRPPRELRKNGSISEHPFVEPDLIEWANNHLPGSLQITSRGSICGGLELLRIAESVKGLRSPTTPDSAFLSGESDEEQKLDGLFRLFDFLLENDVKMGAVSINDVRQGKRDKIVQLLKALRAWEDKRRAIIESIGKSSMQAGPFIAPVMWNS